jgi:hypothetical protein
MGTFDQGMCLHERKQLVLEGIGRTTQGCTDRGQCTEEQARGLRNEADHAPAKRRVLREAALIFSAKSGERWWI